METISGILIGIAAATVVLGPIAWIFIWSQRCPDGGWHENETVETSSIPPFCSTYRCKKCGHESISATYAL